MGVYSNVMNYFALLNINIMCSRGIFQLKYLQLFYCDYGGSSGLIRSLIPTLIDHPLLNRPKIDFRLYVKRN
jgi:large subunit ribosomal protein L43